MVERLSDAASEPRKVAQTKVTSHKMHLNRVRLFYTLTYFFKTSYLTVDFDMSSKQINGQTSCP